MEKKYNIVFRKTAEKQLLKLPKQIGFKIIHLIEDLAANPFLQNTRKMKGFENIYRLRFQNYRIIYRVEKEVLLIEIIKIGHRQNIYK